MLVRNHVLPDDDHEVELIIQDRFFTDDGQLDLPVATNPVNGVTASLFGDFICVNGMPWPVLDVEPRKYRFRIVNGSDSRIKNLKLNDANASFLFVGTELGLLRQAIQRRRVPIAPGERYDVVIDFTGFAGKEITMTNAGPGGVFVGYRNAAGVVTNNPDDTPFGFGAPPNPASTGLVMKFRVGKKRSFLPNATVQPGTILGEPMEDLIATKTRGVLAYQGRDGYNRATEFLGSMEHGTAEWHEKATEVVKLGDTEVWEFHNLSPVAHPVHIHLVDFQVIGRQPLSPFTKEDIALQMCNGLPATGARVTSGAEPIGVERPAEEYERGPKDTVIAYPNEVTRVVARFDKPGEYIWHCHILHHEDHAMMRPLIVGNGNEDDPALQAAADRRFNLYCNLQAPLDYRRQTSRAARAGARRALARAHALRAAGARGPSAEPAAHHPRAGRADAAQQRDGLLDLGHRHLEVVAQRRVRCVEQAAELVEVVRAQRRDGLADASVLRHDVAHAGVAERGDAPRPPASRRAGSRGPSSAVASAHSARRSL